MTTGLVFDDRFLLHKAPYDHPEHPGRLLAIRAGLEREGLVRFCRRVPARPATDDELTAVHTPDHVWKIDATAGSPFTQLDPDTYACADSAAAARLAAGGLVDLTLGTLSGQWDNGFAVLRPPGHHAEANAAMGFCLFNNVAIAAEHARRHHGLRRVAVMDFDVHHGNGTQHMFESDGDLFYASTHQSPLYPGTGDRAERGVGNICNAPLPPGAGSAEFRAAMSEIVLPALDRFQPELLLISAGFDAHHADPLANLELETADYAWATAMLRGVADRHCQGRLVSTLEGGYDLDALAASAAAHVRALMA